MNRGKLIDLSVPAHRFRLAGFILLGLFLFASVFAPLLTRYDPYKRTGAPFEKPNRDHILGCNDVGHDLFSELLYGGRVSLAVGIFAAIFSTLFATLAALLGGYFGGALDRVIMRIVDVVMSLPFLPLVIVLGVFIGPGIGTQILVISIVMWAHPCRELRSQVMKIKESGFISASRAMGETSGKIVFRHVLPELMPLIVPQFVRVAQSSIMIESALSFLGLGDPVVKSWGSILFFANTRAAFLTGAWTYWVVPPGLSIALVVLAFSFIGFSIGGRVGLDYRSYGSFILSRLKIPSPPKNDIGMALSITNLSTVYNPGPQEVRAVEDVFLELVPGKFTGLVGESGCGKTTIAMSVLGLLRSPAAVTSGAVYLGNDELLGATEHKLNRLRGNRIAYIPQNAMNALNPVTTIRKQIIEAIKIHRKIGRDAEEAEVKRLFRLVGIPEGRTGAYPHELSGGMKQRVVIALALANSPDVLIADEPTTGLDVLVEHGIVQLLSDLKDELNLSILFITHDLPLVMRFADDIAVMYQGKIVDRGSVDQVYYAPTHVHTKNLFHNFPRLWDKKKWERPVKLKGPKTSLVVYRVSKTFHSKRGLFGRQLSPVHAVRDVTFWVSPGEVVGIIGGSGSGKSTIANLITGLEKHDNGTILINGDSLSDAGRTRKKEILKNVHFVFQDPYQSMRNHMRVLDVVAEPLIIHGINDKASIEERVRHALMEVNLPADSHFLRRLPTELSGGQRQRLAFARAIVLNPNIIIADEPTSMLDVSMRMELLELMERLREIHQIGYIFITHDIALARHFCDRILVLREGELVEEGVSEKIIASPEHFYTRKLIVAAEEPDLLKEREAVSI